jgi:NitT/TauT family transport system permease protein
LALPLWSLPPSSYESSSGHYKPANPNRRAHTPCVGETLGARGFGRYRRVSLPAALPPILTGLKIGWSFAWRSLMAGELLYSGVGLGRILQNGRDLGDMAQVIAAMLIIAMGLLMENIFFRPVEARLHRKWGLQTAAV